MYRNEESAAAENAAFIKTACGGSEDPGDDNASRVKAGAEVFSKEDASAEASKNIVTEMLGNASENALIAANLSPPDGSPDMRALGLSPPPSNPYDARANAVWLTLVHGPLRVFRTRFDTLTPRRERPWEAALGDPDAVYDEFTEAGDNGTVADCVAIATGEGIVGIDIDNSPDRPAQETLDKLIAEGLPGDTLIIKTPSGGFHLIFCTPLDVQIANDVKKWRPGVDIRGHHGYLNTIGSARPQTIRKDGTIKPAGVYEVVLNRPIAALPQKFIDEMTAGGAKAAKAERTGERGAPAPVMDLDLPDMSEAARRWLRDEAPNSGDGREATCLVVSTLFSRFALSPETAVDVLMDGDDSWNEKKTKYPWGYDEDDNNGGSLIRIARDLYARRTKAPGSSARAKLEDVFDVEDVEAPTPELAAAHAARVAAEAAKAAEAAEIATDLDDDGLEIISADECFEVEGTADERPLVSELLDLGAVSVLYAPSNEGKSFVGAGLGYAVATGASWGGRETTKGAVVYVAYEGARRFRRRLAALIAHYMPGGPVPLYLVKPPKSSIYSPAWQAAILKTVAKIEKVSGEKVRLVIVDTLMTARAGSGRAENDNDAMNDAATVLRKVAEATGAHVMALHHTGKDKEKGMRGASALEGNVDTALALDGCVIRNTKQRDYDRAPDLSVEMVDVLMPPEKGGASSRVAVVAPPRVTVEGAIAARPSAERVFGRRSDRGRFEDAMLGALARLDGGKPGTKVAVDALRDELKAVGELEPSERGALPGSERKRFQRGRLALHDRGDLVERNGSVWRPGK